MINRGSQRIYIQSAYMMPDPDKIVQEQRLLIKINDNFRKIIVTYDDISPYHNEDGFLNIGLAEFLKNDNSLDL